MKRLFCLGCLILLCTFPVKAKPIVFTPKWTAQSQFAGYYVAEKMGFYKAEGLDVKIQHPSIAESSFSFLEKGRAQFVVMNLSQAITARAEGVKVINVMQTSQTNSLMLISHTPFHGIKSLNNRQIAVWNHLSQTLLDILAERYDLDVEWIRFNSGINLYLSKAVDICMVGSYNEFPQLAEYGAEISPDCIFKFSDYGYNLPEDGLYVTEEYYNQHKEEIRKFVNASIKGWKWVNENQEATLDIIMDLVKRDNIGTNRYHQRKMLEEILRLQCEKGSTTRTYKLSPKGFSDAMQSLFSKKEDIEAIKYNDFVK